jgi:hypothetical protein
VAAFLALAISLAGCGSLGPRTLDRDQINYGNSIGDNWKNQMLANLVKMRYVDMPVFVDVGQIVAGYTLETQVSGSLGFGTTLSGGDSQALGAAGRYTDRPTITYMPKTGESYLRSLLEPVNPANLLALIAAGYNPELLFTWAVESINGVRNFSGVGGARLPDPKYYEFVDLLVLMQQRGAVGFEVKEDPDTGHTVVFFFSDQNMTEEESSSKKRVRELLGLNPDQNQFTVQYSPFALQGNVLSMQTRSVIQVLNAMARFVDVPADKADRASPGYPLPPGVTRPFAVHSSKERPEDAFASFLYYDDWYWIDHEDLQSKRVFTLMLFLTTLTNRASSETAPVLTIPTN